MGELGVFSGLGGVKLESKKIECAYFGTYTSTSWNKKMAKDFMSTVNAIVNILKEKGNYKKRLNKWPYFPPTSCISIRRKNINKNLSMILVKKFNELAIDFRLATFFSLKKNEFNLINEFLTYYSQNESSYDRSRYKKFLNKNWWVRRNQAFEFINYLDTEKYRKNIYTLDYLITKVLNKLIF